MITLEQLRSLYDAEPFRPFDIVIDDGRRVRIKERLRFAWSPQRQTLAFDNKGVADWVNFSRVEAIVPVTRRVSARRPREPQRRKGHAK